MDCLGYLSFFFTYYCLSVLVETNTSESPGITVNLDKIEDELKEEVKNLQEKLVEHKNMIVQDQKLLESTEKQLTDSSKALEEHEARVAALRLQLQRAERLKVVQKDLVHQLQIQVRMRCFAETHNVVKYSSQ